MRKVIYVIIIGFIIYSCEQKKATENLEDDNSIKSNLQDTPFSNTKDSLQPEIISKPVLNDSIAVHIFKANETLWDLGRKYYGNRHYSSIIATYNKIENVRNIKNGTIIRIPPLANLLRDSKLKLNPINDEIDKIVTARTLFMSHEKLLSDLRDDVEGRDPIQLPIETKIDIQKAASLIEETMTSLRNVGSDSIRIPLKTVGQLNNVFTNLNNLSEGKHDGPYQYDLDMFHQNLIHAINNSIIWAQNNYH